MSLLIKKGRLIDPATNYDAVVDILVEGGIIKKIAPKINRSCYELIDAANKVVVPGLIDMHTHLREPGREDEETIQSGTQAAAKGGFTTICCMPNTDPPIDEPSLVEFIYQEAERRGSVEVLPIATISKARAGKDLSPMGRLKKAGVVAFSDDGDWVVDSNLMRRALEYVKMLNLPLISHCEDRRLSQDGVMNEGYISTILGLKGMPKEAEEVALFRDLVLCKMTESPLHVSHLSTADAVELIRKAKVSAVRVTTEVTPHHFTLTDREVKSFDTNTKVNPPLRIKEDVEALKEGLKDGSIDVIATDHAPHLVEEKEKEYNAAPFGIVGLETALGLVIKELVQTGTLTLMEAMAKLTINPARILRINRGLIEEGAKANLTIFDLEKKWLVTEDEFSSKSKNSPFLGWEIPGRVEWTIVGGKVVYQSQEK
ncbi:MAG: dihydroorotase [bacterium]